jgi:hypothetical protein
MPRRRLDFVLSSSPRSLSNVLLFTSSSPWSASRWPSLAAHACGLSTFLRLSPSAFNSWPNPRW